MDKNHIAALGLAVITYITIMTIIVIIGVSRSEVHGESDRPDFTGVAHNGTSTVHKFYDAGHVCYVAENIKWSNTSPSIFCFSDERR